MTDDPRRERALERLLRHGAADPLPPAGRGACLDGEALAAWSAGALAGAEQTRAEEHLADCARCQAMLAALSRATPAPVPAGAWWRGSRGRWLVPLATAATVAAILVALPSRTPPAAPMAPAAPEAGASPAAPAAEPPLPASPTAPPPVPLRQPSSRQMAEAPLAADAAAQAPRAEPFAAKDAATVTMTEFSAPGGRVRWRITESSALERSIDGGLSWQPIALPETAVLMAGDAPSAAVAWVVGERGAIFRTSDGGTFAPVPFVSTATLRAVDAVDARQATVTTGDGRAYRTEDGATWTLVPERDLLQDMAAAPF